MITIWIFPKGTKTAASASSHAIAAHYHLDPIDIGLGRYLLRYPTGLNNGLDGLPVKAGRVSVEPAFQRPDKYDLFIEGDAVNAWTIDRTWFNPQAGLELFLKQPVQQRVWRLWQRTDANGTAWELNDETGLKLLEDATMSSVVMKLVQAQMATLVTVFALPDGHPNDHLVLVER